MAREREPPAPPPSPEDAATTDTEDRHAIHCRRCEALVTDTSDAIAIEGKHAHDFVNPAGVPFRIRCFGAAPGANPWGDASSFFSWFPGHTWRIAVCASCGVHLGWVFEAKGVRFVGLIVERVVES